MENSQSELPNKNNNNPISYDRFEVGTVPFNPDSWGPPESVFAALSVPNNPSNILFAPFAHSEKLGRIADWTRNLNNQARSRSKHSGAYHPSDYAFDFSGDDSFACLTADENVSFRLVNTRPNRTTTTPIAPSSTRSHLPQHRDEEDEARKRQAEKELSRCYKMYNNRSQMPQHCESSIFKWGLIGGLKWKYLKLVFPKI
ncbi:Eukaryotic translation initiation factor 3 subunit 7 (eIF-3 [Striga hermonthica]|uniref:Eukaryotic translation initiation factor 3 subunit 7 (eIF-3) n=1 Tax=Striga hermonthica TaxID=68872 RepID=A0A9N7R2J2_STRHE|nr:Eukaryotic translation initiation factor 3 subunit 7 (eIF-3 [Striga hermonthica]